MIRHLSRLVHLRHPMLGPEGTGRRGARKQVQPLGLSHHIIL